MSEKIILISKGATFMINAVRNNLKEAGFDSVMVEPEIKALTEVEDQSHVLLLYLGPYVSESMEFLVYLKDLVVEKEKELCAIGGKEEFDELFRSFPEERLTLRFERPVDIHKLTDSFRELMERNDAMSRRKSILLVDDDPTYLKLVRTWLSEDYRVTIVSSGMQAITYLAQNRPDLILLDYEMPVTTGPQVLEMIRSEPSTDDIPVIFLTGHGERDHVMQVVALKPEGYLLKSMKRFELVKAVNDFFEARKGQV